MQWTFLDFVDENGTNRIKEWVESLPPSATKRVKAKLNAHILHLQAQTELAGGPYMTSLHGECANLLEIKLRVGRVQYRPLACYGPGQREVTLLFGAEERGGKLKPTSACSRALKRRELVLADTQRRRVCDHDFS